MQTFKTRKRKRFKTAFLSYFVFQSIKERFYYKPIKFKSYAKF